MIKKKKKKTKLMRSKTSRRDFIKKSSLGSVAIMGGLFITSNSWVQTSPSDTFGTLGWLIS
ncbi:MAG: twin-arginine translocation signal domain-containing protein [Candidatus Paceibacterota bacterium]